MSPNLTSTRKLNSLRPVYCPLTNNLIVAEVSQMFDIPNGRVTWFHCEACGGWHTVIDNFYPEELPPLSNPTQTLNPPPYLRIVAEQSNPLSLGQDPGHQPG